MPKGPGGVQRPLVQADLAVTMRLDEGEAFTQMKSRTGSPSPEDALANRIKPTLENQREGESGLRLEQVRVTEGIAQRDETKVTIVITKPAGRINRLRQFDFGVVLEMQDSKVEFIKDEVKKVANSSVNIDRTLIGIE